MNEIDLQNVLFEYHPMPMFLFDENSLQILQVNQAAVQQYGYSKEEFSRMTIRDLRTPDKIPEMTQFFQKTRSFIGNIGVWEHRSKSGRTFLVEIHAQSFNQGERELRLAQTREVASVSDGETARLMAQSEIQNHIESTSLGVMQWNRNTQLQYISNKLADLFGYNRDQLLGQTLQELIQEMVPSTEQFAVRNQIDSLTQGKKDRLSIFTRIQTDRGKSVPINIHHSVLRDQSGQLISILSIIENQGEIEEAKKQLKAESEKLLLFVENSTDVISRHSPDLTYTYVSPSIQTVTGYKPEELLGKNAGRNIHPDDIANLQGALDNVIGSNQSAIVEFRFLRKDGTYIWMEAVGKVVHYPDSPEPMEVHVSSRVIEDRKQLEEDLRSEKQFIQTALESLPGLFYMIDENQNYILWNKSFEETLELTPEEVRKAHPLQFYKEEDHERILSRIEQVFTEGTAQLEADLYSTSGKSIPHYITGRLFESKGKKYVIGTAIDITEQKRHEQELELSLKEKQVLLQEIHHRVKNNLAVISGLLELQVSSTPHPDVEKALGDSQLRVRSMALIHETLYQSEQLSRIQLDQIAESIIELSRKAIDPECRINVQLRCQPVELTVNQALPATLIINELVSNAFEHAFGNDRTGTLEVTISKVQSTITIEVSDNGTGFPMDVIRGESGNLGSTIIHTLINQLNAKVTIENRDGAYVAFTFDIEEIKGSASSL